MLSFVVFGVGCGGATTNVDPPAGNTEVNLLISDPATPPDELAFSVDYVSYRITCPDSTITLSYDDSVDITGEFEIVDGADPPVWTLVTDLPLSTCWITLWVFHEDEVVCSGSDFITILDDNDPSAPNKVDIVLVCSLSVNAPDGDLEVDGSFVFIHGNYCPKLTWLNAVPKVVPPVLPLETAVQTSSFDEDNQCGQNCDPQTCDLNVNPPMCTPGPDLGLISTLSAMSGVGTIADPNAMDTTYACDPLLPGPVEICAWVTDGDIECDKHRCITVVCPDLCENVVCDDGNECTSDRCDPLNGLCSNDVAPDGLACADCSATCVGGTCSGPDWTGLITGTAMTFVGQAGTPVNRTLVNPYSGAMIPISGNFNVNTSSYEGGVSLNDTLFGTFRRDFLLAQDPIGTQRICGVENVLAQDSVDALFLADEFIVFGDMLIAGGPIGDIIWANVGNDTVQGGAGVDLLDGGRGNDTIDGGSGNDTITLWHGSGFDSISGGVDIDRVEIDAIQSQIRITPAANPSYEYDVFALGVPMAEIREVEFLVMRPDPNSVLTELVIDLATCVGGPGDVCNLCGNDALNGGEGCDDGNNVSGDGCTPACVAEY